MDLTKYYKIFAEEAETYLQDLELLLIQAEKRPDEQHFWKEVHGRLHSLKGMARTLSLDHISIFCHSMEVWCQELQQGRRTVTPLLMETLFNAIDLLKELVTHGSPDQPLPEQQRYDRLLARFQAAQPAPPAQPGPSGITPPLTDTLAVPHRLDYVRVRYNLIEELLGLAQEVLLKDHTLPPLTDEQLTPALKSWLDEYGSSLKQLMFRLTELRLMSIHHFSELFTRTLRDLGRQYGKQVELQVHGGNIEADISLLERLREPLIHIFRNCIAHGIETPEQRRELNKPASGSITLNARRKRDNLEIRIADDGRGIDRAAVTAYLMDRRRMSRSAIRNLSSATFYETILDPEFSSTTKTTRLAGRGIGMGVVHQMVMFLGGTLTIDSQPEQGTQYTLLLPLSLSTIDALIFRLGDYDLALPSNWIRDIHCREYKRPQAYKPSEEMQYFDLGQMFKLTLRRRKTYHLLYLQNSQAPDINREYPTIEVAVDQVIGVRSLMMLPPGELMARTGIYAGVGILDNGVLAPVLDPEGWFPTPSGNSMASQKY